MFDSHEYELDSVQIENGTSISKCEEISAIFLMFEYAEESSIQESIIIKLHMNSAKFIDLLKIISHV